jgi:hypothetical protein
MVTCDVTPQSSCLRQAVFPVTYTVEDEDAIFVTVTRAEAEENLRREHELQHSRKLPMKEDVGGCLVYYGLLSRC